MREPAKFCIMSLNERDTNLRAYRARYIKTIITNLIIREIIHATIEIIPIDLSDFYF